MDTMEKRTSLSLYPLFSEADDNYNRLGTEYREMPEGLPT